MQQGFFAVNQPTRSAIVPRIVPIDMVPAANALSMTVFSLGVIVGPLLVGILIPLVGLPWLYFIDALTLVAILYAVVKLPPIPPLGERRGRAKVLDGLAYLRLKPLLLMTFVVDIIAMVCGMPRALFPQMAQETFGGPPGGGLALGMLNAGLAIGSLIGGLTGGWIHRIYRQGIAIVAAILVWGLSMALFGTTSVLWLAVLYLAIGGWADLVSAVYRSTILQVTATDEMRGRIQGVFTVVVAGGPRVADLVHGVVADATSTAFAVTAGGIATIVLTVVAALLGRSLWLRLTTSEPDVAGTDVPHEVRRCPSRSGTITRSEPGRPGAARLTGKIGRYRADPSAWTSRSHRPRRPRFMPHPRAARPPGLGAVSPAGRCGARLHPGCRRRHGGAVRGAGPDRRAGVHLRAGGVEAGPGANRCGRRSPSPTGAGWCSGTATTRPTRSGPAG